MIQAAHAMFMAEVFKARGMPLPTIAAAPVKSVLQPAGEQVADRAPPSAPAASAAQTN